MLFSQTSRGALLSACLVTVLSMYAITVGALVYTPAGMPRLFGRAMSSQERTVYDPEITSPDSSTVWVVNSHVTVTWDTSDIPHNSVATGELVLGYRTRTGDGSEHLDLSHPLANNFLLTNGQVHITVPEVNPGGNYIVVLMGDSGNRSPEFTIMSDDVSA